MSDFSFASRWSFVVDDRGEAENEDGGKAGEAGISVEAAALTARRTGDEEPQKQTGGYRKEKSKGGWFLFCFVLK